MGPSTETRLLVAVDTGILHDLRTLSSISQQRFALCGLARDTICLGPRHDLHAIETQHICYKLRMKTEVFPSHLLEMPHDAPLSHCCFCAIRT